MVRLTGISKTTLHKIYKDESTQIDFDTIDKLCDFLDVTRGETFEYVPHEQVEEQ